MNKKIPAILLCGLLALGWSCRKEANARQFRINGRSVCLLHDARAGGRLILNDKDDPYFERLTKSDMAIQLQRPAPKDLPREALLADYRASLAEETLDFTFEEYRFLKGVLRRAGRAIEAVAPGLLPEQIRIVKIKGSHYGPTVVYSRGMTVLIPAPELQKQDEAMMLPVLIHELFHLISKSHPEKRDEWYRLAGFFPLGVSVADLAMPEALRNSLLTSPDAPSAAYGIELETSPGRRETLVPVASSRFHHLLFSEMKYLPQRSFCLYPLDTLPDGRLTLITDASGASPLSFMEIRERYLEKVTDNTANVLHPEEILADNFTILALEIEN